MRKKFIPLSLALCLTLSGCGGNVVLERSYSVSAPHSEVYWENEGADTLRADSYQDLVNALLLLLGEHSEEGVVRIYSEEGAAAMAEQACKEVQEETALGAYLLDYISYTDTQERAYYEMHVRLGYRRTAEEQEGIINATSPEAIPDLLRAAAAEGADRLVVRVSYFSTDRAGVEQMVRDGKLWISRGASVAVFPEGTRSKDGEIHRFKAGAFTLAKEAGVEILPVVLDGTKTLIKKNALFNWGNRITIRVLPPVSAGRVAAAETHELMQEVHDAMCAALAEIRNKK